MSHKNSDDDLWAFKSHLLNIMEQIESDINKTELSDGPDGTVGICRSITGAIFGIIRSIYCLSYSYATLSRKTLQRSLIEYLIDLEYISLKNDAITNKLFYNYFILVSYWQSIFQDDALQEIKKMAAVEYGEYISENVNDLLPKEIYRTRTESIPQNKRQLTNEIDLYLEGLGITKSDVKCLGLQLRSRVNINDPRNKSIVDKELKKRYLKHWSGKSSRDRFSEITTHSEANPMFQTFISARSFSFLSNFTHPTSLGTHTHKIHNPDADDEGFGNVMQSSDLIIFEHELLSAFETATFACCRRLDKQTGLRIWNRLQSLLSMSPKIVDGRNIIREMAQKLGNNSSE